LNIFVFTAYLKSWACSKGKSLKGSVVEKMLRPTGLDMMEKRLHHSTKAFQRKISLYKALAQHC